MNQTEVLGWINTTQDEYLTLMSGQPTKVALAVIGTLVATIIGNGIDDKVAALDALARTFSAALACVESYDTNGAGTIH